MTQWNVSSLNFCKTEDLKKLFHILNSPSAFLQSHNYANQLKKQDRDEDYTELTFVFGPETAENNTC